MQYLNQSQRNIKNFKNFTYSIRTLMKRTQEERKDSESDNSRSNSLVDSDGNPIEPDSKRAKMPKKSKYRMRAHINPMGDLTIPT